VIRASEDSFVEEEEEEELVAATGDGKRSKVVRTALPALAVTGDRRVVVAEGVIVDTLTFEDILKKFCPSSSDER